MGFPIQKEMNKMAKKNVPVANAGKPWSAKEEENLCRMIGDGFNDKDIGTVLDRSTKSIQVRKVRIRAGAGKIKPYNKAITMTEEHLEFLQWADFHVGHMGEGKNEGLGNPYLPRSLDMANMDQFVSDED